MITHKNHKPENKWAKDEVPFVCQKQLLSCLTKINKKMTGKALGKKSTLEINSIVWLLK